MTWRDSTRRTTPRGNCGKRCQQVFRPTNGGGSAASVDLYGFPQKIGGQSRRFWMRAAILIAIVAGTTVSVRKDGRYYRRGAFGKRRKNEELLVRMRERSEDSLWRARARARTQRDVDDIKYRPSPSRRKPGASDQNLDLNTVTTFPND